MPRRAGRADHDEAERRLPIRAPHPALRWSPEPSTERPAPSTPAAGVDGRSSYRQGLIKRDIDPKSHRMDAGVFGLTQIGVSFDAVAHCNLLVKPREL